MYVNTSQMVVHFKTIIDFYPEALNALWLSLALQDWMALAVIKDMASSPPEAGCFDICKQRPRVA